MAGRVRKEKAMTSVQCPNCGAALQVRLYRSSVVRCSYCGTNTVLKAEVRSIIAQDSHSFASKLFRAIDDSFDLDEPRDLVVRLNEALPDGHTLQFEDIQGSTQKSKARELVLWCRRRNVLQPLVDTLRSMRPEIEL